LPACCWDGSNELLLARIHEKVDALLECGSDHEKWLRKVERNQWTSSRATTLIGVALAYVGRKLGL
jgi:hypothetical protein